MHHFSWKKAICHSSISALIFLCNVFRLAFFVLFCLFNFTRSMMQDDGRDLKCDDKQTLCHNFLPDWRLEVDSRKSLCHLFCKDNIAFCQFSTFVMIPTNFQNYSSNYQVHEWKNHCLLYLLFFLLWGGLVTKPNGHFNFLKNQFQNQFWCSNRRNFFLDYSTCHFL